MNFIVTRETTSSKQVYGCNASILPHPQPKPNHHLYITTE